MHRSLFSLLFIVLLTSSHATRHRGGVAATAASSQSPPSPCQILYDTSLDCSSRRLQRISSSLLPSPPESSSAPLWTSIDLSDNRFLTILSEEFQLFPWINELLLENNRLKRIPKEIEELTKLQILNLKNNKIKSHHQQQQSHNHRQQQQQDASGKHDNNGSDADAGDNYEFIFDGNPNLTYVDLGINKIQALPNFLHKRLDQLSLASNEISDLPSEVFPHLPALRVLSLAGNQISEIPSRAFHRLSRLETLSLADNAIAHLSDDALWGLTSLKDLYLGGNRFRHVPSPNMKLLSLSSLELDGNPIMAIGAAAFTSFPHLEKLSLRSLQIDDGVTNHELQLDPAVLCGLDRLNHVLLADSFMNRLDYCLWRRAIGTRSFVLDIFGSQDIQSNQLVCDCDLFHLLAAAAKGHVVQGHASFQIVGAVCHSPQRLHGYLAEDVYSDELETCPPADRCPASCAPETPPPDEIANTPKNTPKNTPTSTSTKPWHDQDTVTQTVASRMPIRVTTDERWRYETIPSAGCRPMILTVTIVTTIMVAMETSSRQ